MKTILKAPLEGLVYPFRNVGMLLVPFIMAFVVYAGLIYILFEQDVLALAENRFGTWSNIMMNVGLLLIVFLAVIPFLVAIVRNVVLGEKIDPLVMKRFYMKRELSVVWAFIKLMIAMFVPVLLAMGVLSVVQGVEFMRMQGQVAAMAAGELTAISWLGTILFTIGLLGMFLVLARGSMVFVTGSLDRGVSIRNSFEVTRHRTMLTLLTILGVVILTVLLLWLSFRIAGLFGFVVGADDLLALSHGGKLVLTAVIAFVRLLVAVIFVAAFSKLYLVLTSKKK